MRYHCNVEVVVSPSIPYPFLFYCGINLIANNNSLICTSVEEGVFGSESWILEVEKSSNFNMKELLKSEGEVLYDF